MGNYFFFCWQRVFNQSLPFVSKSIVTAPPQATPPKTWRVAGNFIFPERFERETLKIFEIYMVNVLITRLPAC
jgi:hypothetical protein